MSNCATSFTRFTITKGVDNTFVFTIKADGSTLPMEIVVGDTFTAYLKNMADGTTALTKALTVADALSGRVQLVITEAEADALVSDRGNKEDRYYLRPNYRLMLDCSTTNNGDFIAKIDNIYVD